MDVAHSRTGPEGGIVLNHDEIAWNSTTTRSPQRLETLARQMVTEHRNCIPGAHRTPASCARLAQMLRLRDTYRWTWPIPPPTRSAVRGTIDGSVAVDRQ